MKTPRRLITFVCAALAAFTHPANAAPGDLDLTFCTGGVVTTAIGSSDDFGSGVVVQSDGGIIVAGRSLIGSQNNFALARYKADGSLDTRFNLTGKMITTIGVEDLGRAIALQSNGKIVVAGTSYPDLNKANFAVVRYNSDGSLDNTFNGIGKVTTPIGGGNDLGNALAVQADGKIVVVGDSQAGSQSTGTYHIAVVRYNADGSLDTTFNGGGKVTTPISTLDDYGNSVAMQSDGKIVVAGRYNTGSKFGIVVVRYNTDGSLDPTFNVTGKATTSFGNDDQCNCVVVQNDGKILVAGHDGTYPNSDIAVARFNTDGSLDSSFGSGGKVLTAIRNSASEASSLTLQSDGKIVVTGFSGSYPIVSVAVVRYNADGSLDTTFNGSGKVITPIGSFDSYGSSVAMQSDGKIVVAGHSYNGSNYNFAVLRFDGLLDTDGDGIPDIYETGTGVYVSAQDTGTNPNNPDSDGDGLNDGQEVNAYHSNPNVKDTDGDGFDDGFEVATGFSPTSAASTPDAVSAIDPAVRYRFNAANGISYRIEVSTDLASWTTLETPIIGTGGVITRLYPIEGQAKRYFRSRRN